MGCLSHHVPKSVCVHQKSNLGFSLRNCCFQSHKNALLLSQASFTNRYPVFTTQTCYLLENDAQGKKKTCSELTLFYSWPMQDTTCPFWGNLFHLTAWFRFSMEYDLKATNSSSCKYRLIPKKSSLVHLCTLWIALCHLEQFCSLLLSSSATNGTPSKRQNYSEHQKGSCASKKGLSLMIQLSETELLIEKTRHEGKGEQRGLENC